MKFLTIFFSSVLLAQTIPAPGPGVFSSGPVYVGLGDTAPGAYAYWGLRAYTVATIGARLANICNASDGHCGDINSVAGGDFDIATATAAPFNCTTTGAPCTVKILYDQTLGSNCSGSCDASQSTIANRPVLTFSCIGSKVCMTGVAGVSLGVAAAGGFLTEPISMSFVANQTTTTPFAAMLIMGNDFAGSGFNGANLAYMYEGAVLTAAAADGAFHAIQSVFGPTTSDLTVDGSVTTGAAGNLGGDGTFSLMTILGQSTEVAIWHADNRTLVAAINTNQHTYWGF